MTAWRFLFYRHVKRRSEYVVGPLGNGSVNTLRGLGSPQHRDIGVATNWGPTEDFFSRFDPDFRGGLVREANQDARSAPRTGENRPKAIWINRTEHGGSRIWMLRESFSLRDTRIFSLATKRPWPYSFSTLPGHSLRRRERRVLRADWVAQGRPGGRLL